jgi:hypothetical protein
MNRVKLWVFTVLVAGAGFLGLRAATISRRADVVAAVDARLASAAAHVAASGRAIAHEASAAATLVARDDKLLAALHAKEAAPPAPAPAKAKRGKPAAPPPPSFEAEEASLREVAREALSSAERTLGFDLPSSTVVSAGNREWLARQGEPASDGEAVGFLRGAVGGQPRRGHVRLNGGLWFASAVPAGEGAGVVVLVPLDDMWARVLAVAAGADVTLSVPDAKPVSTARPLDVPLLHGATKLAGAGDVGRLGDVDVSVGPLKLPRLPQPVAGGAALRARAVPIQGVNNGFVVVSVPAASALDAAAAFHWRALAGLVTVLLVGLVLGFFVRSTDPLAQVPEALLAAAARIEKGDFAARAPKLAGKFGTVAAALNSAAEVAGPAQAARGGAPPATMDAWSQGPGRAANAPQPAAPRQTAPMFTALASGGPASAVALQAAAPGAEADEESHWQQVFQDFLLTRASCGEAAEGLTYERFRQKLEANKAQLVAKYGCKTVRFQVYVKDGKAALKATPVK